MDTFRKAFKFQIVILFIISLFMIIYFNICMIIFGLVIYGTFELGYHYAARQHSAAIKFDTYTMV